MKLSIRKAASEDSELILSFIKDLAEFEKLSDAVSADTDQIKKTLFSENPAAEVLIAEKDSEAAGFALYFFNYSTFLAKRGLYLEDLFVKPEYRGLGIGKALLASVAKEAVRNNCGRMEWSVLEWNPAREFYEYLGAKPLDEWLVYRISGEKLFNLAENCL
ncbi:MAG: GNAT family N-acetyltransferase [Candidatus Kapabacteria bacterium]|nr:GNAT family N-acetyltransferase [Ignavibacteriota bacterium]MCW5885612.1 GNAT family N-acetyltransferase [Candidatus Kapabacteria bacterium]